jgi:hypothetical protein
MKTPAASPERMRRVPSEAHRAESRGLLILLAILAALAVYRAW